MKVEYWINTPDGYDNRYMEVDTTNKEEAFRIVKKAHPRSKSYKIITQ